MFQLLLRSASTKWMTAVFFVFFRETLSTCARVFFVVVVWSFFDETVVVVVEVVVVAVFTFFGTDSSVTRFVFTGPDCFRHYEMMLEGNIVMVPETYSLRRIMEGLPVFFFGEPTSRIRGRSRAKIMLS